MRLQISKDFFSFMLKIRRDQRGLWDASSRKQSTRKFCGKQRSTSFRRPPSKEGQNDFDRLPRKGSVPGETKEKTLVVDKTAEAQEDRWHTPLT